MPNDKNTSWKIGLIFKMSPRITKMDPKELMIVKMPNLFIFIRFAPLISN